MDHSTRQIGFQEYLHAITESTARIERLEHALRDALPDWQLPRLFTPCRRCAACRCSSPSRWWRHCRTSYASNRRDSDGRSSECFSRRRGQCIVRGRSIGGYRRHNTFGCRGQHDLTDADRPIDSPQWIPLGLTGCPQHRGWHATCRLHTRACQWRCRPESCEPCRPALARALAAVSVARLERPVSQPSANWSTRRACTPGRAPGVHRSWYRLHLGEDRTFTVSKDFRHGRRRAFGAIGFQRPRDSIPVSLVGRLLSHVVLRRRLKPWRIERRTETRFRLNCKLL